MEFDTKHAPVVVRPLCLPSSRLDPRRLERRTRLDGSDHPVVEVFPAAPDEERRRSAAAQPRPSPVDRNPQPAPRRRTCWHSCQVQQIYFKFEKVQEIIKFDRRNSEKNSRSTFGPNCYRRTTSAMFSARFLQLFAPLNFMNFILFRQKFILHELNRPPISVSSVTTVSAVLQTVQYLTPVKCNDRNASHVCLSHAEHTVDQS